MKSAVADGLAQHRLAARSLDRFSLGISVVCGKSGGEVVFGFRARNFGTRWGGFRKWAGRGWYVNVFFCVGGCFFLRRDFVDV